MKRQEILARVDYWVDEQWQAEERVNECRDKLAEVLGELAVLDLNTVPDGLD